MSTYFKNRTPLTPLRWPTRGIPDAIQISTKTFNEVDMAIEAMKDIPREFELRTDTLVHLLAMAHKGIAQQKSRGPLRGDKAWVIPVRRIEEEYYHGWRARRITLGAWEVFNPVPHAFFIEHGINPRATGEAVPRPILRQSGVETVRFVARTRVGERFSSDILGPLRDKKGRFRTNAARTAAWEAGLIARAREGGY
jgi:hypothetical protein